MNSSFAKQIQVLRYNGKPKLLASGEYLQPKQKEVSIQATIQPLKANEVNALPEGMRTARAVKVYSDVELNVANQSENTLPDRFTWRGTMFEVVASDMYQSDVINHYRAYAVEVNEF